MMLKILSPSKGRANSVITKDIITDLSIVVPFNEVDKYKEHNPDNEIIGTPKHIKGITPTRQWIIENFGDHFQIDDDVEYVRNFYNGEGEPYMVENPQMVRDIIERLYFIAKESKTYLFGFGNKRRPNFYKSHHPLRTTGYVCGSHFGVLKDSGYVLPNNIPLAEDYYLSCLAVYKHRRLLLDERYGFMTKENFKASGDCSDYRTSESILNDTIELRKCFGNVIHIKQATSGKKNSSINMGERVLRFPY